MNNEFETIKNEILSRARKAHACTKQYRRAGESKNMQELCTVIKDNFWWACNHAVLTVELIEQHRDLFAENEIYANTSMERGFMLCDSATVTAYDSATVRAYDRATVTAYDRATVTACDRATVTACDSATVRAYDSATVTASGNATVEAYNRAKVTAYDRATVRAYDSTTVTAYDSAYCTSYSDIDCKLSDNAIYRVRSTNTVYYISYSGGKDSDVILELAKMAGIPYRAIYKNTTIDPPGTIKHCKEKSVEVFAPTINFFDLVKKKGCPTRRARFCCEYLKEYKVLNRTVQGIRRSESVKRAKRYGEPEMCRIYPRKQGECQIYFPILEWTDDDVAQFIAERGIKCHPLYYDEQGNFHVERRLGCIGCPLRSDNGKSDFQNYPRFLKQLIRSAQIFIDTHHSSSSVKNFGNAYNLVFHNLFFDSYEKYQDAVTGGLFPETAIDAKAFLEDYFKIDLTI